MAGKVEHRFPPVKNPGRYSHETVLAAAQAYYIKGNCRKAAKEVNSIYGTEIPHQTISAWKRNNADFQNAIQEFRDDNEDKFRAKTTILIQKGLDEMQDRLEFGNIKVDEVRHSVDEDGNKTVEVDSHREKVGLKDLTYATGVMTDKLRVSLNLPTRITQGIDQTQNLLERFEEIAAQYMPKEKVVSTVGKEE